MGRRAGQARRPESFRPADVGEGEGASWGRSGERKRPVPGPLLSVFRLRGRRAYFHPPRVGWIRPACGRWWGHPYPWPHYAHAVSITEDAPAAQPPETVRAWWGLVAGCGLALVLVAAVVLGLGAAAPETRTTSYRVLGGLAGIDLILGDADVQID